jgi:glycosyltransferase involved in cell wall biosynthesis
MIDLAQFRTFARRYVAEPTFVLYLHESQITYPTSPLSDPDLSYAVTNWLSAYSADRVLFNSGYHRDVFFEGLPRLLRNFPDLTHEHLIDEVAARSEVLPTGVDLSWVGESPPPNRPPRILWNHRWDHDKDPDSFAAAVEQLIEEGVAFELVLLGARPPNPPAALTRIREIAGGRIVHDGEAPVALYRTLVSGSDVLVSTAGQEFFGVSVVEASAAGCRPVLPNRLAYPWLIPTEYHDMVLYGEGGLVEGLKAALADPVSPVGLSEAMHRYSWGQMAPAYDRRFAELAAGPKRP